MYFEGHDLVTLVTLCYDLWLYHGDMLVNDLYYLLALPCVMLCFTHLLCGASPQGVFEWVWPSYFEWSMCCDVSNSSSLLIIMIYLLILVVYTFGARDFVSKRSIYWDSLIAKWLLGLRILEYKKTFGNLLKALWMSCTWLLCFLLRHFNGSCMQTTYFLWRPNLFLQGSDLLEGRLWRRLASSLLQGVINCYFMHWIFLFRWLA